MILPILLPLLFAASGYTDRPEPILIPNHRVGVESFEFSPSDQWILTFGLDERVILWDLTTLRPVLSFWEPTTTKSFDARFSSDGKRVFVLQGTKFKTYYLDGGEPSETDLNFFSDQICEVRISPDGSRVAIRACYSDSLDIQPVPSGNSLLIPVSQWKGATNLAWRGECITGQLSGSETLAFDARNGHVCAPQELGHSAFFDSEFELVKSHVSGYELRQRFASPGQSQHTISIPVNEFEKAAVSHNGGYVAIVDKPHGLSRNAPWRVYDARLQRWLEPDAPEFGAIRTLRIVDGGLVSIDENVSLAGWRAEPLERGSLAGGSDLDRLRDMAISENGKALAGLTWDREEFGAPLGSKLDFHPVGTKLSVDDPSRLQVSNDGNWLGYIASDGYRRYLQLDGPWSLAVCKAPKSELIQFAFSPDSSLLAVSCAGTLAVADLRSYRLLPIRAKIATGSPVAFEATEGWLVTATEGGLDFRDSRTFDIKRHFAAGEHINAMAFAKDIKLGAVQTAEHKILMFLYDKNDPPPYLEIDAPDHDARVLTFDRVGAFLVSGGDDGLIRFRDVKTGRVRVIAAYSTLSNFASSRAPHGGQEGDWIAVTPEGPFDSSGRGLTWLTWRRPSDGTLYPGALFFSDLYTPGLLALLDNLQTPLPLGWDSLGPLRFPGMSILLHQPGTSVQYGPSTTELCVTALPTAAADLYIEGQRELNYNATSFVSHPNRPKCPYSLTFRGQIQVELLNRFEAAHGATLKTPWDRIPDPRIARQIHFQAIWIDQYDLKRTGFEPLRSGAESDRALKEALTEMRERGSLRDKLNIWESLHNESATRQGIIARLNQIAEKSTPEDLVILYFAGHGTIPTGRTMFHFVTYDADNSTALSFDRSTLSSADFADAFRKLNAKRVILLVETCQSGAALEGLGKAAESVAQLEMTLADLDKQFGVQNKLRGVSFQMLASASPLQISRLRENEPGRLAEAFAAELRTQVLRAASVPNASKRLVFINSVIEGIRADAEHWPLSQQVIERSLGFNFALVKVSH